jgi:hypothetical protein
MHSLDTREKMGVHQLFVDFKKALGEKYCSVFGVPMKLFRLIKMCFNETYSKVRVIGFISKIV